MRRIEKGPPPREIIPYRNDTQTSFDDFPYKDAVRESLAAEQGSVCCYCMRRIRARAGHMKIEHWASQRDQPERRFDWTNLLGACLGGEGNGDPRHQTCDTRKGAQAITVSPTGANVAQVHFSGEGRVFSRDPAIDHDLNATLNLNDTGLVYARKMRLEAVLRQFAEKHKGAWKGDLLLRELKRWRPSTIAGPLLELCEVVAQELDRRIARATHSA